MTSEHPIKRDDFWRGPPEPVRAWAAIKRDGSLMPNSVRERATDVILACGDCVPLQVLITYLPQEEDAGTSDAIKPKPDWMLVYRKARVPLYWIAADGSRRAVDDPPPRKDWSVEMSGADDQY